MNELSKVLSHKQFLKVDFKICIEFIRAKVEKKRIEDIIDLSFTRLIFLFTLLFSRRSIRNVQQCDCWRLRTFPSLTGFR